MKTVLVSGTHDWRNDDTTTRWYMPGSAFVSFLRSNGIEPLFGRNHEGEAVPFIWSTNLGGVGFGDGDLLVWASAGWNLYWFCVPPQCPERAVPGDQLNVITHSHGMQVALYAAALGLKIHTLITVTGPPRKDMRDVTAKARPNIKHWLHIHSDNSDWWQVFGTLFDGKVGSGRKHPSADVNVRVDDVGHSGLLRNPTQFAQWQEQGWLEVLK
jgi:hypothetical protein